MRSYLVIADDAGQRIDQLFEQLKFSNRSRLQHAIDEGWVTIEGQSVRRKDKVREGQTIEVAEPKFNKETVEFEVIYENKDFIAINKPVGYLSHAKDSDDREFTVVDFLKNRGSDLDRAGLVHRLDRETSGVIVAAKTQDCYDYLKEAFAERKVQKTYLAVCDGRLRDETANLAWPIERNPKRPHLFRVGANGKPSETSIMVKTSADKHSLVEVSPKTGRTHQIRVHLSHYGNAITGDQFYGGSKSDRLYLHALKIEFADPDGTPHIIEKTPSWDISKFGL